MGSRRTGVALRRRAAIALGVWALAFTMLAVAAAIPEGPTAALSVDDAYPAVGTAVHFNASASAGHDAGNGRIVGYRFSFGDGQGTGWQTSPLAAHAYAAKGNFTAGVTVVDNRGLQASATAGVHPGASPPPPTQTPDVVPIQAHTDPAEPKVNDSVNLTAVVLNRGGLAAAAATLTAYDVPPNGSAVLVGRVALQGPIAPSVSSSAVVGPFVVSVAGNHTLRIVIGNVTPAESSSADHELDLVMTVLPAAGSGKPGGGPSFVVSPLALGLGGVAVAAGAGAAVLLLRRPPHGPLEPPPPTPPDQSPPPIWPP